MNPRRRAAIVTLGCDRNEADSSELAGRLTAAGWDVGTDGADADVVLVNTCGFIAAAKRDSIDTILTVAGEDPARPVVAVGCMAERYGRDLAVELPEANAVLGFDQYGSIGEVLDRVLAGESVRSHAPTDRRTLLPITPVDRQGHELSVPGHDVTRRRLTSGPVSPLKIASGCDRRCAFCAIPQFRGSLVSRPIAHIATEAHWLIGQGVRELYLVSENSTSYGKDLAGVDLPALVRALEIVAADGESDCGQPIRIRLSYLQPAELRPQTIDVIAHSEHVVPYFDLPFQHADERILRSMRRFGSAESFLALVDRIRAEVPNAGLRSNFIVGFPGESEAALQELIDFVAVARLDAVGVFEYSDEEGTAACSLPGKLPDHEIRQRAAWVSEVADDVCAERAAERVGELVQVLVHGGGADSNATGRAGHQGPEDGEIRVRTDAPASIGATVSARVETAHGIDLLAFEEKR